MATKEEPIWDTNDDHDWQATFTVWHMLPWLERKEMATKFGFQKIGDFEEFIALKRVAMMSNTTEKQQKPYPNDRAYAPSLRKKQAEEEAPNAAREDVNTDDDEQEDFESDDPPLLQDPEDLDLKPKATDLSSSSPDIPILQLPEELLHTMFSFLSVETFCNLALVTPFWKSTTRTEAVYRKLCERLYLKQSKRRLLQVSRFGNSYRSMLFKRPRVRCGLYVMKFAQVKEIQRDMWCEIPVGAILETVYYRYILFREDGTLIYALTTSSPQDMIRRLCRMLFLTEAEPDRAAVWGTFSVQGKNVIIMARQEWQHVKLKLSIINNDNFDEYGGRFGTLSFDRHLTSPKGNFDEYAWPNDITEFKVPHEVFRYVHDDRLN